MWLTSFIVVLGTTDETSPSRSVNEWNWTIVSFEGLCDTVNGALSPGVLVIKYVGRR